MNEPYCNDGCENCEYWSEPGNRKSGECQYREAGIRFEVIPVPPEVAQFEAVIRRYQQELIEAFRI